MSKGSTVLWVVAAHSFFSVALDWELYFLQRERPYQRHSHIGLYRRGAVRAVGREELAVDVEVDTRSPKLVSGRSVEERHIRRIEGAVEDAWERYGWDIGSGYRFFLVDRFLETNFICVGEPDQPRYLELEEWLPRIPHRTERLAVELSGRRWA